MTRKKTQHGFTLLELLVVIGIIALIVSVIVPNLLGARERARDAQKKAGLHELKNALRLFYNDYQRYPLSVVQGSNIEACKTNPFDGIHTVYCASSSCFFAGAAACSDAAATVYMKSLPDFNGTATGQDWNYYSAGGDKFCLTTTLANTADSDLGISQSRCTTQGSCTNAQCGTTKYCVCED